MSLAIRPARSEELAPLFEQLAAMDPWRRLAISARRLEEAVRGDCLRRTLVAMLDGRMGGCVSFCPVRAADYLHRLGASGILTRYYGITPEPGPGGIPEAWPEAGYVNLLATLPGVQGHGVGRQLLEAAEEAARTAGSERLFLCVSGFNTSGRAFYKRHGYTQIGILSDCLQPGNNEHLMAKLLADSGSALGQV